ncbi:hypothetical protein QN224_06790 [Sinorhizobium sp. 8-89]|nr:hypothetical protein [Sinorhizobium sp. 7-81]MDK1385112.1 hypothetical protein [Sinorhizobium sp. 7-81]
MKATEFDRRFDAGEDISKEVDWDKARRPNADDPKAAPQAQSTSKDRDR